MAYQFQQPYLSWGGGLQTLHGGNIGAFKEIGRTTLGSSGTSIDLSGLSNKLIYQVLYYGLKTGGSVDQAFRLNADTGSNYSQRQQINGAEFSGGSKTSMEFDNGAQTTPTFAVGFMGNYSTKEKGLQSFVINQNTAGAANTPTREVTAGKHSQTTNPISQITAIKRAGTGSYDTGSEIIVLGYDPADTHTTNFWELIGSGTGTGVLDITASASKKYNWIQGFFYTTTSAVTIGSRLGNGSLDTGSNYSTRYSISNGAETTSASQSNMFMGGGGFDTTYRIGFNLFFINISAQEKLLINHIAYGTSGAGTALGRIESVDKWANTSAQANHFGIYVSTGSVNAVSEVRWYGAD